MRNEHDKSTPPVSISESRRISGVDGWRAISVTLVIVSHLVPHLWPDSHSQLAASMARDYGALGVRIFFVISGFVICRGFIQEQKTNKKISIAGFYIRRVFRILPPLLVYLLILCSLALTRVVDREALGALKGLLFVCNIEGIGCGGYLGNHQWSLAVEEQFYLVFPLLFVLSGHRPGFFSRCLPGHSLRVACFGGL